MLLSKFDEDYSYLRQYSIEDLCIIYFNIRGMHNKGIYSAIHYIVGEKELLRYYVTIREKAIKEEDFDEWYKKNPRKIKMKDIKAAQRYHKRFAEFYDRKAMDMKYRIALITSIICLIVNFILFMYWILN